MISKINKKVKDKNHKSNFSKNFKVLKNNKSK